MKYFQMLAKMYFGLFQKCYSINYPKTGYKLHLMECPWQKYTFYAYKFIKSQIFTNESEILVII